MSNIQSVALIAQDKNGKQKVYPATGTIEAFNQHIGKEVAPGHVLVSFYTKESLENMLKAISEFENNPQ